MNQLKKAWECRKCAHTNEPGEEDGSLWKCTSCKHLRWPWMIPALGGAAALLLILAVTFLFKSEPPEEKFLKAVESTLQADGGNQATEGVITAQEMDQLQKYAERLQISQQRAALIEKGKKAYLERKRKQLKDSPPGNHEITSDEREILCALAGRMGLTAEAPECSAPCCDPEELAALFRRGEFDEALKMLGSMAPGPQKETILARLQTPLAVTVQFQYLKKDSQPSALLSLDAPEVKNLILTNQDHYRLQADISQKGVYLYVFQKDHYGQLVRLFPDPVWSQAANPLEGNRRYRIPLGDKDWLYLDELPGSDPKPIEEKFFVIASPWKAEDIEESYGRVHEASAQPERQSRIDNFMTRLRQRMKPDIKALYYKEFQFLHGK